MRKIRGLILLQVLLSMIFPFGLTSAVDIQYNHVYTLESPNPMTHSWFGYQVKISGDIIVVNEPYSDFGDVADAGKIYLYDRDGNLLSTLQSPNPGPNYKFGYDVDVFDDAIIVGEWSHIGDLQWAGRAHLYTTDGEHLLTIESPEPRNGGYFGGNSVSIGQDLIAVSETHAETSPGMAGKVHLYDGEGKYLKSILSPSPIVYGKFGATIEVGEGMVLVGEYGSPESSQPRGPGSVYLFDYDGTHLMTLQASESEEGACFGDAISTSRGKIVIGERWATVEGILRAGRAYIFDADGELLRVLQSPNPKSGGEFGHSVAIDEDRIVVGEWDADVNPGLYEGKAYVFDVDGNLLQELTAPDPCPRAAFGLDVDIEGETIVVGECWADIEGIDQAGRVHIFKLGPPVEQPGPTGQVTPTPQETPRPGEGGIPGFPIWSIVIAIVIISLIIRRNVLGPHKSNEVT